jgi:hypothetical protein
VTQQKEIARLEEHPPVQGSRAAPPTNVTLAGAHKRRQIDRMEDRLSGRSEKKITRAAPRCALARALVS